MTFPILAATLLVIAVAFFAAAGHAFFWERYFKGVVQVLVGACFLVLATGAGFIAVTLAAYHRLTGEEHVASVQFVRKGDHEYTAMFTYPGPDIQVFDMRGDDWQIDARVLKWIGPANLLGFNTLYRLDRLSGRYTRIEDERRAPRTVYALRPAELVDTWELARKAKEWLPWVDAVYGSATYLPMADGAIYDVRMSPTGLLARPGNDAARKALTGWK